MLSADRVDGRRLAERHAGPAERLLRDLVRLGLEEGALPAAAALVVELDAQALERRERWREQGRQGAAERWARHPEHRRTAA